MGVDATDSNYLLRISSPGETTYLAFSWGTVAATVKNGLLCIGRRIHRVPPGLQGRVAGRPGSVRSGIVAEMDVGCAHPDPGDTMYFQLVYRDDPTLCGGSPFNTTNAISIRF